jgi:hypothetical protein
MLFAFPVGTLSIVKTLLCHLPYQVVIISIVSLIIYWTVKQIEFGQQYVVLFTTDRDTKLYFINEINFTKLH